MASATGSAPAARDPLPWAVAAIALVALIAMVAGQKFGGSRDAAPESAPVAGLGGPVRAPDISNMSPREITTRLFDRVMTAHEQGLNDSAQSLALMAIPAFDLHDSLDADLRYDLGRIAEVTGVLDLAKAQADTILLQQPNHLLGLLLSARVARLAGDTAAARAFDKRLLSAEPTERARNLTEYQLHKTDLDRAIAEARRGGEQY
jgi:hypothetical protein